MNYKKLVSVIVPTKNSVEFLEACLESIKNQNYKNIEIIVVDNNSKDNTKKIALKYTKKVFEKGPERSIQRNFGANKAKGKYILFIDSDMTVERKVIQECVEKFEKYPKVGGLIIPEKSIGESFWAKCRKLEKTFYEGVGWIEAARFYRKNIFDRVGGFDPKLISGEDWDLSSRVEKELKISRIKSFVLHNEGKVSLTKIVKKKYYYSKHISKYLIKSKGNLNIMVLDRYMLFFSKPKKLFQDPILGTGLLFMKTCEFGAGACGYLLGSSKYQK